MTIQRILALALHSGRWGSQHRSTGSSLSAVVFLSHEYRYPSVCLAAMNDHQILVHVPQRYKPPCLRNRAPRRVACGKKKAFFACCAQRWTNKSPWLLVERGHHTWRHWTATAPAHAHRSSRSAAPVQYAYGDQVTWPTQLSYNFLPFSAMWLLFSLSLCCAGFTECHFGQCIRFQVPLHHPVQSSFFALASSEVGLIKEKLEPSFGQLE